MRRTLRRWLRASAFRYFVEMQWIALRVLWQRLAYDQGAGLRTLVGLCAGLLLGHIIQRTPHAWMWVTFVGGMVLMAVLPSFLSWRGWSNYHSVLIEVLNADIERMDQVLKEEYLREMFGDSQPPKRLADKEQA